MRSCERVSDLPREALPPCGCPRDVTRVRSGMRVDARGIAPRSVSHHLRLSGSIHSAAGSCVLPSMASSCWRVMCRQSLYASRVLFSRSESLAALLQMLSSSVLNASCVMFLALLGGAGACGACLFFLRASGTLCHLSVSPAPLAVSLRGVLCVVLSDRLYCAWVCTVCQALCARCLSVLCAGSTLCLSVLSLSVLSLHPHVSL